MSACSTPNSLTDKSSLRPERVATRASGSSSMSAARRMRGEALGLGRARPRSRRTSSSKSKVGEVIVGADAQTAHTIERLVCRGEHEHHRAFVVLDDLAAYRIAVDAWEIAVEDNHVVVVDGKL